MPNQKRNHKKWRRRTEQKVSYCVGCIWLCFNFIFSGWVEIWNKRERESIIYSYYTEQKIPAEMKQNWKLWYKRRAAFQGSLSGEQCHHCIISFTQKWYLVNLNGSSLTLAAQKVWREYEIGSKSQI